MIYMYIIYMGGVRFFEGWIKLFNNMLGFVYCLDFIKVMEKNNFLLIVI